ncbi:MAG: hypothetical protein DRQ55_10215 [Planctomycetota bacterium]|nr:MAG: hypothetical protein DRQ55_10215 [Planctomycetota bacterium]
MRPLFASALLLGLLAGACAYESDGGWMNASLPALGSELPAIAALTLDGRAIDNDSFKGKTTLLNLWFYH